MKTKTSRRYITVQGSRFEIIEWANRDGSFAVNTTVAGGKESSAIAAAVFKRYPKTDRVETLTHCIIR